MAVATSAGTERKRRFPAFLRRPRPLGVSLHERLMGGPYPRPQMDQSSLEKAILRALCHAHASRSELAGAVGLPRTNVGRLLTKRLRDPLKQLRAEGLVEEDRGLYYVTEKGREAVAERFDAIR